MYFFQLIGNKGIQMSRDGFAIFPQAKKRLPKCVPLTVPQYLCQINPFDRICLLDVSPLHQHPQVIMQESTSLESNLKIHKQEATTV